MRNSKLRIRKKKRLPAFLPEGRGASREESRHPPCPNSIPPKSTETKHATVHASETLPRAWSGTNAGGTIEKKSERSPLIVQRQDNRGLNG